MELGEFVRRARASRLSKKSRFDDAFERVRRELRLLDAKPALPHHQLLVSRGDGSLIGRLPDKTERVLSGKRPEG